MERWAPIQPLLDEFQAMLSPSVPRLEVIHANDRAWSMEEYKRLRAKGFPSKCRGVYLIFDEKALLQYVGLATVNFDKRVWSHDNRLERRWTDIICFDDRHICLASALEYFLVTRLNPPFNTTFIGHALEE